MDKEEFLLRKKMERYIEKNKKTPQEQAEIDRRLEEDYQNLLKELSMDEEYQKRKREIQARRDNNDREYYQKHKGQRVRS